MSESNYFPLESVERIAWRDPLPPVWIVELVTIGNPEALARYGFTREKDGTELKGLRLEYRVIFLPAESCGCEEVIREGSGIPRWGHVQAYGIFEETIPLDRLGTYRLEMALAHEAHGRIAEKTVSLRALGISFYHWGWFPATDRLATELPVLESMLQGATHVFTGEERDLRSRMGYMAQGLVSFVSDGPEKNYAPHHTLSLLGITITGPQDEEDGWPWRDPQRSARLQEFFGQGKCALGGLTWAPVNCCELTGEELVRSLRETRDVYLEKFGVAPDSFTTHDSSLTPMLPQIANMVGYHTYLVLENWWAHQYHFNREDGVWVAPDGSSLRMLTTQHIQGAAPGVHPALVKDAIEKNRAAVLVMEEFACNVPTRYLRHFDRLKWAEDERVVLLPLSMAEYAERTRERAGRHRTVSDKEIVYKGWTGGTQDSTNCRKFLRQASTRLAAWQMLAALEGSGVGEATGLLWRKILRQQECHLRWFGTGLAAVESARSWVSDADGLGVVASAKIAAEVKAEPGDLVVVNPLGWNRGGEVFLSTNTPALRLPDGQVLATQRDGSGCVAFVPEVPSAGWLVLAKASPRTESQAAISLNCELPSLHVYRDGKAGGEPLQTKGELNIRHFEQVAFLQVGEERGPVFDREIFETPFPGREDVRLRMLCTRWHGASRLDVEWELVAEEPFFLGDRKGGGGQEAPYFPAWFASLPHHGGELVVDRAYCFTEDPITSTYPGHPYRELHDWGGRLFNFLGMVRESGQPWNLTCEGLTDGFLFQDEKGSTRLGISFGTACMANRNHGGTLTESGERGFSAGTTRHRMRLSGAEGLDETQARVSAWKQAQELLVPLGLSEKITAGGARPPTGSLAALDGGSAILAGGDALHGQVCLRILDLSGKGTSGELSGISVPRQTITLAPRQLLEIAV